MKKQIFNISTIIKQYYKTMSMSMKKIQFEVDQIVHELRELRETGSKDIAKINHLIDLIVEYADKYDYINPDCFGYGASGLHDIKKSLCLCCENLMYPSCHEENCAFVRKFH